MTSWYVFKPVLPCPRSQYVKYMVREDVALSCPSERMVNVILTGAIACTTPHTRDTRKILYGTNEDETRLDIGRNDAQLISKHSSSSLTEYERLAGRARIAQTALIPKRSLVVSNRGSALTSVARHGTKRIWKGESFCQRRARALFQRETVLDGRR